MSRDLIELYRADPDADSLDTLEAVRITKDPWVFIVLPTWLQLMIKDGYIDTVVHPRVGFMVALLAIDVDEPVCGWPGDWIVRMHTGEVCWTTHRELENITGQKIADATTTLLAKLS